MLKTGLEAIAGFRRAKGKSWGMPLEQPTKPKAAQTKDATFHKTVSFVTPTAVPFPIRCCRRSASARGVAVGDLTAIPSPVDLRFVLKNRP